MEIAIIGAGASGCFVAANITGTNSHVTVFEKTGKALQKVKASGGGRCNVTHAEDSVPELVGCYPRGKQLLKKSLYRFPPAKTVEWFEKRGVPLKTEADGRMFPVTDSSQTIMDCLSSEMMSNNATVLFHKAVERIETPQAGSSSFVLHFSDGTAFPADKVVVTTGGFPKPEQYHWLTQLGHTIQAPVPSLFTFNIPHHPITQLMGLSVPDAIVKIRGTKIGQRGPVLITHWGLSGPAILKTSAFAARELADRQYSFHVVINWLGDVADEELREEFLRQRREQGKQLIYQKNPFNLPKRLWEYMLQQSGIDTTTRWGDLPAAGQNSLMNRLIRDSYEVKGKTTFKEEFVTCGGITLAEVNPETLESRKVPGLYFAGEILDVDAITGGFNFQHAWSSAWIVAQSLVLSQKG